MTSSDRRASDRRGLTPSAPISLGAVLADERRERHDRREQPRRREDFSAIAHVAHRLGADPTLLDMIAGTGGMRRVATFACGCSATEPIGQGSAPLYGVACALHAAPAVTTDRRRSR